MEKEEVFLISQPDKGYRFSQDPFLLASFVGQGNPARIADIGTGNGILPLLLRKFFPNAVFIGIDIQYQPLLDAKENFPKCSLVNGDIRTAKKMFRKGAFDMIVSNPPYRKAGSGRISRMPEKAVSKHEISLTIEELIASAGYMLAEEGVFYLCHIAKRSEEVIDKLRQNGFADITSKLVKTEKGSEPYLILLSAKKSGKKRFLEIRPLIIYDKGKHYSKAMINIYKKLEIKGLGKR